MKTVYTPADVRRAIDEVRTGRTPDEGVRIGFVPTMGFLHEGHLSLVDRARERADFVVLSIFVNPLQFGEDEDLERYPRDPERDAELARERGVDLIYQPDVETMYPGGEPVVRVVASRMTDCLCGAERPGHFDGVLTVVAKLFHTVRPDIAVFGQKDLQQAVLIQRMVEDLELDIEIDVAPIVREDDGLALSSRNVYLSEDERSRALALPHALSHAEEAYRRGERDADQLLQEARTVLEDEGGLTVQYLELVHPDTLEPVEAAEENSVIAAAVFVGETRLIDNVILR